MKKILFALFALASVALTFSACSDDDEEEMVYPSHLNGTWDYVDASTGYTGCLQITDLYGGQYAYFCILTPNKKEEMLLNNTFKYDPKTGIGTIEGELLGGITVTVQAVKGSDKKLNVTVNQLVEGGSKTNFSGEFNTCDYKEKYNYPSHLNGTWKCEDASTGYTGTLKIEDLYGGQYARLRILTPEKKEAYVLDNTFKYNPFTGTGSVAAKLEGGISVDVQTFRGSDKKLDVKVMQIVEGGYQTNFSSEFTLE